MINLVHHLKVKYSEDYTKYVKGLNKDKQQKECHSSSKTTRLKQISLADAAKRLKVWGINDS